MNPSSKDIEPQKEPNFAELTSEHFNGGSGDTATLYDVAKFIEKLYYQWKKEKYLPGLQNTTGIKPPKKL